MINKNKMFGSFFIETTQTFDYGALIYELNKYIKNEF